MDRLLNNVRFSVQTAHDVDISTAWMRTVTQGVVVKLERHCQQIINNFVLNNPRKAFLCFTALWLFLCSITTAVSARNTQTAEEIAEKAVAATVYLEMTDSNGKTLGFGSGFFVGQNLIATNFHVIEGAAKGTAKQVGKYTKYTIEGISATDKKNDLAIVKVTAFGVKPLPLGDSETVRIGETVYVAGNPRGLEGTFSDGIISSIRKGYTRKRLQMTAPISPGSSGGPVLNANGEVIGVSFMTIDGGQNLNFAIPSRYLKVLLKQAEPANPFQRGEQSISADPYNNRGNTKADPVGLVAAILDYDKAIRLKPGHADAYVNRGVLKAKLSHYLGAIADFDTAIRLKPNDADAYYNRGNAKAKSGEQFAAITDFDTVIRLKPNYLVAYVNRGNAKADLGKHVAAIADYDETIRLSPGFATAYYNRGNAKRRIGKHVAAITDYDTAIRLKPNDAATYFNRGRAKTLLGHTRESKQNLRTALQLANQAGDENLKAKIQLMLRSIELSSQLSQ